MKKRWSDMRITLGLAVLASAIFLGIVVEGRCADWVPSKPIEFVVPAGPGGGSDVFARTAAGIVEAEKLSPVPFVVVNRPGGNAIVGMTQVAQQKGNPYVVLTYHSGQVVGPLSAGTEIARYPNFTFLASIAIDEELLFVKTDSPLKSIKDLVKAATESGGAVTVGGTTTGQDDHICNRLLENAAKIKLRYVSFNSGGEALTALLGGHVQLIWANPGEVAPQLDAKQVRALALAKEGRLSYFPDVPTFREQGYDVSWKMFRGIAAPAGIATESISFYENLFKRLNDSPGWQQGYIKKYMLTPSWIGHQELTKYVAEQEQTSKAVLKELGILK
jgi:putative tricarboxylic transport membrane protein